MAMKQLQMSINHQQASVFVSTVAEPKGNMTIGSCAHVDLDLELQISTTR